MPQRTPGLNAHKDFQKPGSVSRPTEMMSRRMSDPDSPRAMAHRAQAVRSFLDRHGFSDVNNPRGLDESHRIQMKPVYPIEVASDLGNQAMVNMLLDAGAVRNPNSEPSSPTSAASATSKGGLFSFASFCGSRRQRDEDDEAAGSPQLQPEASQPMRSCLSDGSSHPRLESSGSDGIDRKPPIFTRWV